jgi:hypothetical protein
MLRAINKLFIGVIALVATSRVATTTPATFSVIVDTPTQLRVLIDHPGPVNSDVNYSFSFPSLVNWSFSPVNGHGGSFFAEQDEVFHPLGGSLNDMLFAVFGVTHVVAPHAGDDAPIRIVCNLRFPIH